MENLEYFPTEQPLKLELFAHQPVTRCMTEWSEISGRAAGSPN